MIISGFKGINNKLDNIKLKPGQDGLYPLRNAVNVDIGPTGEIIMPGWGTTKAYTATDAHSFYEYEDAYGYGLFVDNGSLKRLNTDDTATTLATVNHLPMSYAALGDALYYSNGIDRGIYRNGTVTEWGIENPPKPPDATATPTGGLYAGEYRIAITWLTGSGDHYQESGTYNSVQVTVSDGGGIHLANFPAPPSYVDGVCVWVSSVNSQDFYLYNLDYDVYPATVSDVYIRYHNGTIKLDTQFMTRPDPGTCLTVHNGGIFWIKDNLIGYTEPHAVSLTKAGNYFDIEHEALALVSLKTGPLYVQTTHGLYAIGGIYAPDIPPSLTKLRSYNGCKLHNVAYSPDYTEAALWTDVGFTRISQEGVQDLNVADFAAPHFEVGSLAYVESGGINKLVFAGRNGTVAAQQHADYTADETARSGRSF